MVRKARIYVRDDVANETHMQMFARLARITNMHGTPGPRKPKSK